MYEDWFERAMSYAKKNSYDTGNLFDEDNPIHNYKIPNSDTLDFSDNPLTQMMKGDDLVQGLGMNKAPVGGTLTKLGAGISGSLVGAMMADTTKQVGKASFNPGFLTSLQPFYIIKRKNRYPGEDNSSFNSIEGYQSNKIKTLSKGLGYTVVEECHLEIPGANQSELNKIEAMLKKGVIL